MKLFRLLLLALPFLAPALGVAQTTQVYSYTVPTTGYAPNGNILSYTDSVNGNWTMTYDSLNRLQSANAATGTGPYPGLDLSMTYDSFGNRLTQTPTGILATGPLATRWANYDANNRITSSNSVRPILYDTGTVASPTVGNGNVVDDGTNHLLYDGDNRVCAIQNVVLGGQVTLYLYDAEGRRVAKGHTATNAWQCSMGGSDFIPDATYVLGQGGEQITESDAQGNWVHTNVYAQGQLLATYDNNRTGLHFHITDPLGSRRVQVSSTGDVEDTCSNLPFGDYANNMNTPDCTGSGVDATEHHFTGKERDAESGLDYFGARYYGSNMGRFMSPDPEGAGASLYNPQSWNGYSYALNNPHKFIDPDGELPILLISAGVGAGVGAIGGAVFDVANQLISNGGQFDQLNGREIGAAALGGAVSGGIAGLTLGLLPAPAALTAGYLITAAVVDGGANVVGGEVQRAVDPNASGSPGVDFATGAIGGAIGTKVAYVRHPLPNVQKELKAIAFSNRRSLRPEKTLDLMSRFHSQSVNNIVSSSQVGTSVTNFVSSSWSRFSSGNQNQEKVCTSATDNFGNTTGTHCQ